MTLNFTEQILETEAHRPSVKERLAAGKALRLTVPRAAHGDYVPAPDRRDPIDILLAQAETRVPELVPVRHARMLASPFAFLRGSAAVMVGDLAPAPTTGLRVMACGDMHVCNFGVFASAERNLVFGINDFDEAREGAWEWDLKRLVASAVVAGRFMGIDRQGCEEAARGVVSAYRKAMRRYSTMGVLELWYSTVSEQALLDSLPTAFRKRAENRIAKARTRTHLQVLDKLTDLVDNEQRIVEMRPLIVREPENRERPLIDGLRLWLDSYIASLSLDRKFLLSRYRLKDAARKVVGVGSVGTRCWIVYLEGRDAQDPLFLQVKEAQPSVLAPYARATIFDGEGHRVVSGQRLIQGAPDIFLGWGHMDGRDFYVRQLRDMKGGVDFGPGGIRKAGLPYYCRLCGWALALAHAKSGDAAMLAGYVGKSDELDEALARFGEAYADQTERDFAHMQAAAAAGRIEVARGEGTDSE